MQAIIFDEKGIFVGIFLYTRWVNKIIVLNNPLLLLFNDYS